MERMKGQEGLASAGAFCPDEECDHYAKVDEGNLIKFGKSKRGLQRYRCKGCGTTFAATRGTLARHALLPQARSCEGHPGDFGAPGRRGAHKQPLAG